MAAGNGKSVEGFSTMIVYILAAILISMSRSISCSHETREQVNENALSADDRRILKLMMDRCVDLYLDPFSSLAENLLEDELIRLKKLNTYRCGKFYNLISWSFSKNGRLTPDYVHQLKEEVVNEIMPHKLKLKMRPDYFVPLRNYSINDKIGGISDEDRLILKPVMEECGKLYLDADATDREEIKYDIYYCDWYFFELGSYYDRSEQWSPKLAPEFVEILREFPKLYGYFMLDDGYEEWLFQTCLIEEKHGKANCDDFRLWKAKRGMLVD